MPEESALDQLLKSGEFLHHLDMDRKTADLVFDLDPYGIEYMLYTHINMLQP